VRTSRHAAPSDGGPACGADPGDVPALSCGPGRQSPAGPPDGPDCVVAPDAGPAEGPDGSAAPDAGPPDGPDCGAAPDAGPPDGPDCGAAPDAGPPDGADCGVALDAGSAAPDAGPPDGPDCGVAADAPVLGVPIDLGGSAAGRGAGSAVGALAPVAAGPGVACLVTGARPAGAPSLPEVAAGAASPAAASALLERGSRSPGAAAPSRLPPMATIVSLLRQADATRRRHGVASVFAGVEIIRTQPSPGHAKRARWTPPAGAQATGPTRRIAAQPRAS